MSSGDARQFAIELARIVHDSRSENVVALDMRELTSVTDFVVLGTGTSDRQIRSVADQMMEYGKKLGRRPLGVAGYENACWVVVDFVDVVIHLFSSAHRAYYDLELLWGDAPPVDWSRSETA